jgi:hypothetical protein
MSTAFADVEKLAFRLSLNDRAKLADQLLASLPDDFVDPEELEEAMRRCRELDENPDMAITLDELDRRMKERFGWA